LNTAANNAWVEDFFMIHLVEAAEPTRDNPLEVHDEEYITWKRHREDRR
jgi:hypothetical protein